MSGAGASHGDQHAMTGSTDRTQREVSPSSKSWRKKEDLFASPCSFSGFPSSRFPWSFLFSFFLVFFHRISPHSTRFYYFLYRIICLCNLSLPFCLIVYLFISLSFVSLFPSFLPNSLSLLSLILSFSPSPFPFLFRSLSVLLTPFHFIFLTLLLFPSLLPLVSFLRLASPSLSQSVLGVQLN